MGGRAGEPTQGAFLHSSTRPAIHPPIGQASSLWLVSADCAPRHHQKRRDDQAHDEGAGDRPPLTRIASHDYFSLLSSQPSLAPARVSHRPAKPIGHSRLWASPSASSRTTRLRNLRRFTSRLLSLRQPGLLTTQHSVRTHMRCPHLLPPNHPPRTWRMKRRRPSKENSGMITQSIPKVNNCSLKKGCPLPRADLQPPRQTDGACPLVSQDAEGSERIRAWE